MTSKPDFPEPAAGQRLGDFELLDPVGAGGFSYVWRARHVLTNEIVALKLPRVAEFIDHLRREALIASRFKDPQVVDVRDVRLDHHPPFLVMDFIPGANLETPETPPPPEQIITAFERFRQIVEVVARLHDAGIAHGDLKPGNVRFDLDGVCRLLDLGLARRQVAVRQTTTLRASVRGVDGRRIAGTLEYMTPEVMTGAPPDRASDVYALGVTLHALLCGRAPAFGVSPRELNPYLPPGTSEFLRMVLHPDPLRRPASASALLPFIDAFIRAERRCLRKRNGHARRLVFNTRMRTLARGLRVLLSGLLLAGLLAFGLPYIAKSLSMLGALDPIWNVLTMVVGVVAFIGMLLGMTTLNAFVMRIPERLYKHRPGHPLWTFMMQ